METIKRKPKRISGAQELRRRGLRAVMIGLSPAEKTAAERAATSANQSLRGWIRSKLQEILATKHLDK